MARVSRSSARIAHPAQVLIPSSPFSLVRRTPQQRAKLADALVRLGDQHRLNRRQAAAALLDLDSRSTRFIGAGLLDAVAISIGVERTPGGLHLAA
jgi:hypothetical protein